MKLPQLQMATVLIPALAMFACLSVSFPSLAMTLSEQRDLYKQARKALSKGKLQSFKQLTEQLHDYPLYPYLRYAYLKNRLNKTRTEEIKWFLSKYDDLPDAGHLRTKWLGILARQKRWQEFLDLYKPQKDTRLQCYQLQARINTGQNIYLLEDIRSVWLAGKSLPDECDPAFKLLYQSQLMDSDLIWQRIGLAMDEGQTSLANFLGKKLPPHLQQWQQRWVEMHNNPGKWTAKPAYEDTAYAREILGYGMQRLARRNIKQALERWDYIKTHYDFSGHEVAELERFLAIRAAKKQHPDTIAWLERIEPSLVDEEAFRWRLRASLEDLDWRQLLRWTEGFPTYPDMKNIWWYWRGRALQETGDTEAAKKTFQRIARERDYYGFLAADRLGLGYKMNHYPLPADLKEKYELLASPAIQRARELHDIGYFYPARREWQHALTRMTRFQMQVAATIAKDWGWHDRAIFTLGRAKMFDDLVLRFPIEYRDILAKYANKRNLDIGWIYGLIRAESAFVEAARSPAGALGLMQVMPATGKMTAKGLGWKKFNKNMLLEAETNIPIGSEYLRQMYNKFDGNRVLATAAYNAGPHRVNKWLPKDGCMDPDVWVEKIPFNETRKYVKRVLSYASIYDWRLEQNDIAMHDRMAMIYSSKQPKIAANLSCTGIAVSLN